jgi:tight adherence protein C
MAELFPDSAARREETRKELLAAGFYQPHALQNLSAVRYAAMMGGMVLGLVWLVLAPARWEWLALSSVVVFPLLGWALPRLYVRGRAAERRNEIERGMPDLLDMLNMCVSQGLTVPDALRRIVRDLREAYPALAQELRIVIEQAGIGDLRVALENFSQRIDIPEVHSFTSLLTQTERMGTSISDALMAYSDTMRESLRQRADEKGNRATFQLLFPTVLCLMPAVYLFLMGPAIIDLSEFFRSGGRDALDQGSRVIQRLNADRRAQLPADVPTP